MSRVFTPGEALSEMVPWRDVEVVDVSAASWTDSNKFYPTHIMTRVSGDVGVSLIDSTGTIATLYLVAATPYAMRLSKIWTSVTSTDVSSTSLFVFK